MTIFYGFVGHMMAIVVFAASLWLGFGVWVSLLAYFVSGSVAVVLAAAWVYWRVPVALEYQEDYFGSSDS